MKSDAESQRFWPNMYQYFSFLKYGLSWKLRMIVRSDLGGYNSLANHTLKLEGASLSHINIWPSKYPNLQLEDHNNMLRRHKKTYTKWKKTYKYPNIEKDYNNPSILQNSKYRCKSKYLNPDTSGTILKVNRNKNTNTESKMIRNTNIDTFGTTTTRSIHRLTFGTVDTLW